MTVTFIVHVGCDCLRENGSTVYVFAKKDSKYMYTGECVSCLEMWKYLCRDTDSVGPDSLGPHYHTCLSVKLLEESYWFPLEAHLPMNAPTKALHSS